VGEGHVGGGSGQRKGRSSFLKKRSKKLLLLLSRLGGKVRGGYAMPWAQKFFGSFFQKRTFLLFY
jgi:hypothetical protein